MRRCGFLKIAGLVLAGVLSHPSALLAADGPARRPNVLVIITDQQCADAMSCVAGRDYLHTPNMDSLVAAGMRFPNAYCANPLCVPSRTAMFTGRYPHETGIQTNTEEKIDPDRFPSVGRIFKAAGYDTGYFGKWHMAYRAGIPRENGFDTFVDKPGRYDGTPAAEFIARKRQKPFLAVASFVNPHDICEWSRGQTLQGPSIGDPPPPSECPPLAHNMAPPEDETDIMVTMRRAHQAYHLFPVGHFTDDKWRQYLWAYYRLIECVDRNVGTVMDALRTSGQEENTLVVFLADHGECHGVHRWNQKTVFYDESTRVPLVITQKGRTPTGVCDVLAQTGVDLIPTLCDFAGVTPPRDLPGRSLKACALGRSSTLDRPYVVAENRMVQCAPVDGVLLNPDGRMLRSRRYKYCLYSLGTQRESLVDMQLDPGEMHNLTRKAEHRKTLLEHREYLRDFARKHHDTVALSMLEGLP